jgi:hypothetical protein
LAKRGRSNYSIPEASCLLSTDAVKSKKESELSDNRINIVILPL